MVEAIETGIRRFVSAWARIGLCAAAAAAQLTLFVLVVTVLKRYSTSILGGALGLSLVALLFLFNRTTPSTYKLAWAVPIVLVPLFGVVFYSLYGAQVLSRKERVRMALSAEGMRSALDLQTEGSAVEVNEPNARLQARYLTSTSPYRLYADTDVDYFPAGEAAFEQMLADIAGAERYVLCEYQVLARGLMWDRLLAVLSERAAAGVDVRIMYDDLGSLFRLPPRFRSTMVSAGIKAHPVNPFGMGLTLRYNNRDHRKLLVVDGRVAFTGGLNIADEYVNLTSPLGHWKDTVVRLEGPGAWSLVVMFLGLWELVAATPVRYSDFLPDPVGVSGAPGVVLPYDDTPFDNVPLGSATYRNMINRARRTVDIFTPYLIIDENMQDVLTGAAASGVRVRIVTPGRADNRHIHAVTRSFYELLIRWGVEIFEYTPGHINAKTIVVDGELAVVGTINFDYRSLYLHQENAVWMYRTACLAGMVADFEATLTHCERITLEKCRDVPRPYRLARAVLRVFAPMM